MSTEVCFIAPADPLSSRGQDPAEMPQLHHLKRATQPGDRTRRLLTMTSSGVTTLDVVVIGAGPAGVVAALRAARLGARTALVTRDDLGGMAANDGPAPVRALAHAARLMRERRRRRG